jgi:cyclohexyl-isocyanide hydratase
MSTETKAFNVVFVLYDEVTLVDFIGATEVFNNVPNAQIYWLAPTTDAVTTSEKMKILPTDSFEEALKKLEYIDVLFIPGGNYKGVEYVIFNDAYRVFITAAAARSNWAGSVCTGGFIAAAMGLLKGCTVSTYWSQIPNFSLLQEKYGFTIAPGYPRFLIDETHKRFSGGGISSSLDLALALTEKIFDKSTAEKAQLFIQYAPGPPVQAGDPGEAPPLIIEEVLEEQAAYTGEMYEMVKRMLANNEAL